MSSDHYPNPPNPGLDPNANISGPLNAIIIVTIIFTFLALTLRLVARRLGRNPLWVDDYLIVIAVVGRAWQQLVIPISDPHPVLRMGSMRCAAVPDPQPLPRPTHCQSDHRAIYAIYEDLLLPMLRPPVRL